MTGELTLSPPRSGQIGRDRLGADLASLGLRRGQDLLVHCSLRQFGRIDGGAATLLAAIHDVASPGATIAVPAQTAGNSLTSRAFRTATAHMGAEELTRFVAAMPGFDPVITPSAGMGAFAEYVRTRPAASRSSHPQTSFAAVGPQAAVSMAVHDLDCHFGGRSPLSWLYAADAAIVLLGVGYTVCTAFHLAEYQLLGPQRRYHCFTLEAGTRVQREFTDIELDDSDFGVLGADLDLTPAPRHGHVGPAPCRLVPLRAAVDFAAEWLKIHRQ